LIIGMPLTVKDGFPPQAYGNDSGGGGRAELGEKFLLAVIPAVVGGDPSARVVTDMGRRRWTGKRLI